MSDFIPAGRTSMVKKGGITVQIQTEYAVRPYPRITTTILNSGKVIHKIEKKLDQPIQSIKEQNQIEDFIVHQHSEVMATINKGSDRKSESHSDIKSSTQDEKVVEEIKETAPQVVENDNRSTLDKLKSISGVQQVYNLDNNGNFIGLNDADDFENKFSKIFKNLKEVMDVFMLMPGSEHREKGVYELMHDTLYFVSNGDECFFISIRRTDGTTIYEKAIKQALINPGELSFG